MNTSRRINVDDETIIYRNKRKIIKPRSRITDETQILILQQFQKEKQLLNAWKAQRANGKKNQKMARKQRRDVRAIEKGRFTEMNTEEKADYLYIILANAYTC